MDAYQVLASIIFAVVLAGFPLHIWLSGREEDRA